LHHASCGFVIFAGVVVKRRANDLRLLAQISGTLIALIHHNDHEEHQDESRSDVEAIYRRAADIWS
jgi:hypothetical protein